MIVIGLTGSIGMGKSTLAKQFKACGAAVLDSDAVVHRLLAKGGEAVNPVAKLFAGVEECGAIKREALAKAVFGHAEKLRRLEAVLHPLVRKAQDRFIRKARIHNKRFVVLDIPLLFETQGEKRCDYTVVATAPSSLQRRRVFQRPHMTEEKFCHILTHQMPDREKRKRGDFIVHTGLGRHASLLQVKQILYRLAKKSGKDNA